MSPRIARVLVFSTAAAVLVLEILAGRLLAPYLGLSLEVFTGIIGMVLAGISLGAWAGGRAADRVEPATLIGPLLAAGGVLAMLAPPIVDAIGPSMRAAGPVEILIITGLAFFPPAAVLSAVSPIVVKAQLSNLEETGTVVGSYSAIGTAGAIFGTFVTGFFLLSAWPTRPVVLTIGGGLVVWGAVLSFRRSLGGTVGLMLVPGLIAGTLVTVVEGPCDLETAYHCAYVTNSGDDRPGGRTLWLDTLRHSYVDLNDASHLEFRYTNVMADAVNALVPAGPIDALFIGGGGFTLPRYFPAERPGSTSVVLEIDAELVDFVEDHLGLDPNDVAISVTTGDARLHLDDLEAGAFDVVVGDAFGGLAVPWHLTTEEFTRSISDRLAPGGVYVLNVIDHPPLAFARAEIATLTEVFAHVAVAAPATYFTGTTGGNFILIGSNSAINTDAVLAEIAAREGREIVISKDDLELFVDGARTLTDDFAPVDQLINPR